MATRRIGLLWHILNATLTGATTNKWLARSNKSHGGSGRAQSGCHKVPHWRALTPKARDGRNFTRNCTQSRRQGKRQQPVEVRAGSSEEDLLQVGINVGGNAGTRSGWPKSPRALAGRLRRAQTPLRALGIEIVFGREGRLGTRTIRITAMGENRTHDTVSTVSRVRAGQNHPPPDWNRRFNRADDADGGDAK